MASCLLRRVSRFFIISCCSSLFYLKSRRLTKAVVRINGSDFQVWWVRPPDFGSVDEDIARWKPPLDTVLPLWTSQQMTLDKN
jgi:hypothetical protein